MEIYNVEYIRDLTEYSKLVRKLSKHGRYNDYDTVISNVFSKIRTDADSGKNQTSYNFSYGSAVSEKDRSEVRFLANNCCNILCKLLDNIGYKSEIICDNNNIALNIKW